MSTPVITFFNNKGGVGKTSLVYHLSWMLSEMGKKVVTVDLDPQANLTSAFLDDGILENLWATSSGPTTIYRAVEPLSGLADLQEPILQHIKRNLDLIPGDVALSSFEETLSDSWPRSMDDKNLKRPFRILTAFWQVAQMAAKTVEADFILADVGPNLGATNRSALIGTDYVVIPLGADLFSLQGLTNLGPTLRSWRNQWQKRVSNWETPDFPLPPGRMEPLGYIVQQHSVRLDRPVKAYDQWVNRIPYVYAESVLNLPDAKNVTSLASDGLDDDPHCLATLKHYRSLIPMAQEKRKPIFHLTPADGAIGSHALAVQQAYKDFHRLAQVLLDRVEAAVLL